MAGPVGRLAVTLRPAIPGDEPAIEAFLSRHAESSMFLRSNFATFGLSGSDDPRSTHFWLKTGASGIAAVFGRSNGGFLMAQAPNASRADWDAFCDLLVGQKIAGITGASNQVSLGLDALGLDAAQFSLVRPEPLYALDLSRLRIPDLPGTLRAPAGPDRTLMSIWVTDYNREAFGTPEGATLQARVRETVDQILNGTSTRILHIDGQPVAKTAFNARLPDVVQIGGVYTPPVFRNRGHARRAVALHLAEARAQGVEQAILFASGEPACRAYESIGFERIGSYTLALLEEPAILRRN